MLSARRFEEIARAQTSMAQKVLDAVPIQEAWTKHQIGEELRRRHIGFDIHSLGGCLSTLVRADLITSSDSNQKFRRVATRPTLVTAPESENHAMPIATPTKPQPMSELDRLSALATRVRGLQNLAANLVESLKEVADDVEDAALEIAQSSAESGTELAKLRALRDMLKTL